MKTKLFLFIFLFTSMIHTNSYSQSNWYWINGKPTGNSLKWIKIIAPDNIVAVGAKGTFLKSVDGGDTWTINATVGSPDFFAGNLVSKDLNTGWFFNANTGIVVGASTATVGAVAYPGYLSRTTDGGNTWNYIQVNDTGGTFNGIYFIDSQTGYMCGGTRARLFKTTNGGLNWDDLSFDPPLAANTYNAVFALDTGNIFLTTSTRKVYYHKSGLDSMWKVWNLPGTTNATLTDVIFKDVNTGYVSGNANYFAYTTDGGNTWTQSNASATVGQKDLALDGGILYMCGSPRYYYKSSNNGANWDSVFFYDSSNVYQPAIGNSTIASMNINGSDIGVIGGGGSITLSNDGGASWRNKNYTFTNNTGATTYSSILAQPSGEFTVGNIWIGSNQNPAGHILYSSNGGTNWSTKPTTNTFAIYGIQFVNANTGYTCGGRFASFTGEMSKTTDGGNSWSAITLPSPLNTYQLNSQYFVNADTGWTGGITSNFSPALLYKTTDGGGTWNQQMLETSPLGGVTDVQMADANTGYVLGRGFWKTTNGGANWIKNNDPIIPTVGTAPNCMFVLNKDVIYIGGGAGSSGTKIIIRSIDGGQTWTDISSNLPSTFTAFKMKWLNLKHGVTSGTSGYMAKTTDGGLTWTGSNTSGSTSPDVSFPNKNAWYTVSDRNGSYQAFAKNESLTSVSVNITMGIEGFWNGKPMVRDTVTVELHNSTAPFATVEQRKEVVTINGYATYDFNVPSGSYYIVMKHRNSLETWSAAPIVMTAGGNYNYDFTNAASQAYNNNIIFKSGIYCLYSGDVNQDGTIDASDLALVENSVGNSGYLPEDVTGDDFVDAADIAIVENNQGVLYQQP